MVYTSYLTSRPEVVEIPHINKDGFMQTFYWWEKKFKSGVPQGSILKAPYYLFYILLNHLNLHTP